MNHTASSSLEVCKTLVKEGKRLPIRGELLITFRGKVFGQVMVIRTSETELHMIGLLNNKQFNLKEAINGIEAYTPEVMSVGDFYSSGVTFTKENAPRAKPFSAVAEASQEASRLNRAAREAFAKFKKLLPEQDKKLFRSREAKKATKAA